MSSRIFIFFCFTKSSGWPSSVDPGAGTLKRYSFAIGLKTCWTRKRSDRSIGSSDALRVVGGGAHRLMMPTRPRSTLETDESVRPGDG